MPPSQIFKDDDNLFGQQTKIDVADVFPIKDYDDDHNLISISGDLVAVYQISSDHNPLDQKDAIRLTTMKDFFLKSLPENVEVIYHIDRNEVIKGYSESIKNQYLKPISDLYLKKIKNIFDCKNFITLATRKTIGDSNADVKNKLREAEDSLNSLGSFYNLKKLPVNESLAFLSSFFDEKIEPFPTNKLINITKSIGSLDLQFVKEKRLGLNFPANFYLIGDQFASILTIQTYSNTTTDHILKTILANKFPFRYSIVFVPINQSFFVEKSKKDLRFYEKQTFGFNSQKIADLYDVIQRLEAGETKIFKFLLNIEVRAHDLDTLNRRVSIISEAFGGDFKLKKESLNLPNAFFSRLPTLADRVNVKAVDIEKEPLNLFFEISPSSSTKRSSPFGHEPVIQMLDTASGLHNFYFHKQMTNPKDKPVGHSLIVGQTGVGKSAFTSFLLANCLKYPNLKIINFDQRQGLRVFTEFAGGSYSDLASGDVELNPFQMTNTENNLRFLKQFICNLANLSRDQADLVSNTLNDSLNDLMKEPKKSRFLNELEHNLSQHKEFKISLKKWYKDGDLGQYFNGKKDGLDFSNPITSFDMTGIMKNPELVGLMMEYITYRVDRELSGNPLIFFIDEMPAYLRSEIFQSMIETYCQEARKKNWVMLMAVQTLGNFIKHQSSEIILDNLENLILFPTANAYDDLSDEFADLFSEDEIRWLNTTNPKREIMIKKKSTGKSTILDIDLNSLENYLNVFNSSADEVRRMLDLKKEDKNNWREKYLNG